KKCPQCQFKEQVLPKAHLNPIDIANLDVWERVAIDLAGPLPISKKGNKYLFCLQDYKSKWVEAKASPSTKTSDIIEWLDEIFSRLGVPKVLVSDRASQLQSIEFTNYLKDHNIDHHQTTAYHHQSNGMIERLNRTFWNLLKCKSNKKHNDWDCHILNILKSYRSARHEAINQSPFEALHKRSMRIALDNRLPTINSPAEPLKVSKTYKQLMKKYYDQRCKHRSFRIGDHVLIRSMNYTQGMSPKLISPFKGPFTIESILPNNKILCRDANGKTFDTHVNLIKRDHSGTKTSEVLRSRGRPRGTKRGRVIEI
ncbi:Uncharacterized protein SSS_09743, partial [Sarcoptes scabiei]